MENRLKGEFAAHDLIYTLERDNVTIDEYRRSMPRLMEYTLNKDDTYNLAFIGLVFETLDRAAYKMRLNSVARRPWTWVGNIGKERRPVFYARAYGYLEALKENILDSADPNMAEKKKQTGRDGYAKS